MKSFPLHLPVCSCLPPHLSCSAPAIILAHYLQSSLCNGTRLSYYFLVSNSKFIWKKVVAHSFSNSMNHCPCYTYTWRQCQGSASVNPTRYMLDNEGFIPALDHTIPNALDCMRALLYSSALALLLLPFLHLQPWIVFPEVWVQHFGFSFWTSVISTFSSATFISSIDFIKLLFPPLSASFLLICPRFKEGCY